ncbi:SIS domain-containing protein [Actinocorallia sp. B10E7]|uniref:D-sedoheptulose-7-phosphate isomerase n=1 Tax=Actinocorallia sp. B10E7 TaxID=3153558 RepID=UPI00325F8E7E
MIDNHLTRLESALAQVRGQTPLLLRWGRRLAETLQAGGRLLACGNGGSAAQAQHLTAELVGRYQGERRPFSALSLHTDASAVTAIVNDYGAEELYARQVRAHGRPGDILLALSTSGTSRNVICAVHTAARAGLHTWALTGPAPNPLAAACQESLSVDAPATATVQEVHLAVVHLLCAVVDERVLSPHRVVVRA